MAPDPGQPWTQVTDGTWNYGDFQLGQPNKMRLSDYAITVSAAPVLTTSDGGKTIRISSPLSIRRVEEAGKYRDAGKPISKSDSFSFVPGNRNYEKHNEVYGDKVSLDCGPVPATVGEVTECTLSFDAPAEEIQNSYWSINRASMAAWPGQK